MTQRTIYECLLNPGFQRNGSEVRAKATLASDAHNAALSLNLVESNRDQVVLCISAPDSFTSFADLVHDLLLLHDEENADAAILEGFAWIVAESERQGGLEWMYSIGRDEFADKINAGLTGKEMNTTKAVAWRRWLSFLGLTVAMPVDRNAPGFPLPSSRIAREFQREEIAQGTSMSAANFLALIARRMPYLDQGRLFNQACQRIGCAANSSRLSPLLSAALRDLHDDQVIRLVPSGDAAERTRLHEDATHSIDTFSTVIIFPGDEA